jgi:osmotically-inducible protein OsmY
MIDIEVRQDIVDALDFEPGIDSANIGVAVERGIVTLTGNVKTYGQKLLVEDCVRHVKGVRGVAEEIEVRFFGDTFTSDEAIVQRAINMINWNTFVPDDAVQVSVHKGWITLTGKLEWQFQRKAAADAVKRLVGVTGVSNNIELLPSITAADVKARIEAALKRAATVDASNIKVNILDDGKVRLEGKVHDWSERSVAERAVWSAPGVRMVEDHLTVA